MSQNLKNDLVNIVLLGVLLLGLMLGKLRLSGPQLPI